MLRDGVFPNIPTSLRADRGDREDDGDDTENQTVTVSSHWFSTTLTLSKKMSDGEYPMSPGLPVRSG